MHDDRFAVGQAAVERAGDRRRGVHDDEVAGGEEPADLGEGGVDRFGEPGADQQTDAVTPEPARFGGLVRFVLVVEDEVERVVVQDRGHGCLGSAPTSSRAW